MLQVMPDPNDFTDKNAAEGDEGQRGNPKAGQFGSGGLTTRDADNAYERAAEQHFKDDIKHKKQQGKKHGKASQKKSEENIKTPPQIGSIEESDEQSFD